jgi:anti-anti-sigma factor
VLTYTGSCCEWAERARRELSQVAPSAASVVVDLSAAAEVDSPTLGLLVLAQKRLEINGGKLSLVCNRPRVLRQFERTGLRPTFVVHPTSS